MNNETLVLTYVLSVKTFTHENLTLFVIVVSDFYLGRGIFNEWK